VRGAGVADTYWPEPDSRLGSEKFETNDLVELREGGVFLRGRASDLINVAGRKVSPDTIESVLGVHPGVRECLVLGLPGVEESRGDTIAAVVAAGPEVTDAALGEFVRARLPDWQVPREWRRVDSLEANSRGKLSRSEWRARWGDR
jgi:acyl-CoA synthetase (AMP-forming)/AMP-acid ligase II